MSETSCKVLAVGAAGKFAGLVVPELVRHGASVRGLVKDASQAKTARENGAKDVAIGDLRDASSLRAALRGVESVFYIAPVFAPDEVQLGLNMVEAAKGSGVRRLVFSSVIHPVLDALENHHAKAPVEEALIGSGLEFTILHPAVLYQNYAGAWAGVLKTGVLTEPFSPNRRINRVDYRDVAEVAAIAMTQDRLVNGTFELAAEGALDRRGVTGLLGEVLSRKIEVGQAPFEAWADQAEIPRDGPVRPGLQAMYAWYDSHDFLANPLTLRAILGREARTLKAYFTELASNHSS